MFPEERSKLIYMQLAGSLPHAKRRRAREEASLYRLNMQNVSIYTQPGVHVLNYRTAAAAALFLHPFWKCRDPCSSVAAAAAGWPSFLAPAEIQSFHSALLRWPRGRGRIPSPTRAILSHWFCVFLAMLLGTKVLSSWLGRELVWSCRNTIGL